MITVLIVDDHDLVRLGMKRILGAVSGLKVIGEVRNGEEAITFVRQKLPDVILMDVKMPGMGGIAATTELLQIDPELKILAISSCHEDPFPARLLQAGACGFITKDSSSDEIIQAIRAVHSGQRYISPKIAEQLAVRHVSKSADKSPFGLLSDRELEVMMLITQGAKVQDIAEKLILSPKTVNSYRYRLFEKLGIKNDVELTHLAIRYGVEAKNPETRPEAKVEPDSRNDEAKT